MLDLSSKNEGTWFYFSPEDPERNGVCLRTTTQDAHVQIYEASKKPKRPSKLARRMGMRFDMDEMDLRRANAESWDYEIVDWKGVAIDGELVECTRENKVIAMNVNKFKNFVDEKLAELEAADAELEEARLKNSPTSSSGSAEEPSSAPAKPA